MEKESRRCSFWLPKKKRFCANSRLHDSSFCGNHSPRSDGEWVPCPIDPSHSVLKENVEAHVVSKCPFLKQTRDLSSQPFYRKGINSDNVEGEDDNVTSERKRAAVYGMSLAEFFGLIKKVESSHDSICTDIKDEYKMPKACNMWIKREIDRKLPFQEKHILQQASILGNLEEFGVLKSFPGSDFDAVGDNAVQGNCDPAVVEFGAGRGYLTQILADCYGISKVFLVEKKSYKLKADRSLRQKESLVLERLRIDIEDLNLKAVETLRGLPYLAIGKHLCGPATDLTLRCCLPEHCGLENIEGHGHNCYLKGLALATCCHHLCQWKHYINKKFISDLGMGKDEFHAMTWFTSWAVDADHSSDLSDVADSRLHLKTSEEEVCSGVEQAMRNMKAVERAALGFKCKQIIDMGRMLWMQECGLDTKLVKYVPSSISPENCLLIARNEHLLSW